MADKKPLRISDDPNDLQSVEFGATDSLGISDGGTSATTANDALNNLLPSQTGNSGKYLQTDGSNTSWVTNDGGGGDTIHIDVGGNNISKQVDRNTTSLVIKEFIYRGAIEALTNVRALFSNDTLASATVEVYDFTNAQVIASHTATNSVYEIKDLGTISNLPTSDAIFQIRVSTGSGSNQETAHFTALRLEF